MPDVFVLPPKPRNLQGKIRDAEDLGETIRQRRCDMGLTQGRDLPLFAALYGRP